MRQPAKRSRHAARPSCESGGSSIAPSPTAWRKRATACSPSPGCRLASGEACEPPTRSSGCTRSSSEGSKRKPCCHRQTLQPCCSGHYSRQVRSTCAKSTDGRRSPLNQSLNRLTSPLDQIASLPRRLRHSEFQPLFGRHHGTPIDGDMSPSSPHPFTIPPKG